jgi:hypothetical protein
MREGIRYDKRPPCFDADGAGGAAIARCRRGCDRQSPADRRRSTFSCDCGSPEPTMRRDCRADLRARGVQRRAVRTAPDSAVSMESIMISLRCLALATLAAAAAPSLAAGASPFPPGVYRCELNQSVHVRNVSADLKSAVISWKQKDYTIRAVDTRTGALRYEDPSSGLVWIMITGKSMLLDARRGQRLADECRT